METQADTRIATVQPLATVAQIQHDLPIPATLAHQVAGWTKTVEDILAGVDKRLLVLVGPCSIHDLHAAMQFAAMVRDAQRRFKDKLFLVMRLFVAKPRTKITGPEHWTGLINDPLRDGSFDMDLGARMARQLAIAITSMGVPIGTEIMNLSQANLLDDLISWTAIGARSVEFQAMRQVGSALATPVGFKNGTGGSLDIAIDAILTANQTQVFQAPNKSGVECKITSTGNPFAHLVLRGGTDGPNFHADRIAVAKQKLAEHGISIGLGVDTNHANSGKNWQQQTMVVQDLAQQIRDGEDVIRMIMMESNIMAGRQDHWGKSDQELTFGLSITDGCESFIGQSLPNMEVLADVVS